MKVRTWYGDDGQGLAYRRRPGHRIYTTSYVQGMVDMRVRRRQRPCHGMARHIDESDDGHDMARRSSTDTLCFSVDKRVHGMELSGFPASPLPHVFVPRVTAGHHCTWNGVGLLIVSCCRRAATKSEQRWLYPKLRVWRQHTSRMAFIPEDMGDRTYILLDGGTGMELVCWQRRQHHKHSPTHECCHVHAHSQVLHTNTHSGRRLETQS